MVYAASRLYLRSQDERIARAAAAPKDLLPTLERSAGALHRFRFADGKPAVWWAGVGTALGMFRDGGFLPGDNDVDFRVRLDYGDAQCARSKADEVLEALSGAGFSLCREVYWDGRPMQYAFFDREQEHAVCDITFFYRGFAAGRLVNINNLNMRLKPAYLVALRRLRRWPGAAADVFVPWPTPLYLRWRFGPEWRTPKAQHELGDRDQRCLKPLPLR